MFGKNTHLGGILNYALATGLITFAGGLIASICVVLGVPVVTAVALLLTLSASVMVFNICRAQQEVQNKLLEGMKSDLTRSVEELREEWQRTVGQRILRYALAAIADLKMAEYMTESNFLCATRGLRQLKAYLFTALMPPSPRI
jgi:hypothetical protein